MWIARCVAALLALVACRRPDRREEYPAKPIRIIVPTAPGGMADILARYFAQKFGEKIKQPVIVENKTGAGGVIAADYVAKSPARRLHALCRLPRDQRDPADPGSQAALQPGQGFRADHPHRQPAERAGGQFQGRGEVGQGAGRARPREARRA